MTFLPQYELKIKSVSLPRKYSPFPQANEGHKRDDTINRDKPINLIRKATKSETSHGPANSRIIRLRLMIRHVSKRINAYNKIFTQMIPPKKQNKIICARLQTPVRDSGFKARHDLLDGKAREEGEEGGTNEHVNIG